MRILSLLIASGFVISAAPVRYEFAGTGSGILEGTLFPQTSVSVVVFGDTLNIVLTEGVWVNPAAKTIVDIAGVGTFDILHPTQMFANNFNDGIGVGDNATLNALFFLDMPVEYDLATGFSLFDPTPGAVNQFRSIPTTGGPLSLLAFTDVTLTVEVTEIPEPTTVVSMLIISVAIGLRGALSAVRQRHSRLYVSTPLTFRRRTEEVRPELRQFWI